MKEFNPRELQIAWLFWHRKYPHRDRDFEIEPYLNPKINAFEMGKQQSWLRKARQSLFLTLEHVAKKIEISESTYAKYEASEESGHISLENLAKAAQAMDCELVYAIRPKNKKIFSCLIWNQLLANSVSHPFLLVCDQRSRGQALAGLATKLMKSAKFRRQKSWSRNANQSES